MSHHMIVETAALPKTFVTLRTLERFIARINSHVGIQGRF